MAKKSRRKGSRRKRASQKIKSKSEQPGVNVVRSAQGLRRDFNPDYQYVIQDLKRIGLIAGTIVTLLIVLSVILN